MTNKKLFAIIAMAVSFVFAIQFLILFYLSYIYTDNVLVKDMAHIIGASVCLLLPVNVYVLTKNCFKEEY